MPGQSFEVGDVVTFRKKHPCGSFRWEILRVGMDFRLKCEGCGHMILIPREKVVRSMRSLEKKVSTHTDENVFI